MMWTVLWNRTQLSEFTATYDELRHRDPVAADRLARSVTKIDRLFEHSPDKAGESRGAFERMVIVPPLAVTFEVHTEEQVVYVMRFHYSRDECG